MSRGAREESLAQSFLEARGLRFVLRNFSVRGGELDLVMRDGPTLVVVEVRKRTHGAFGTGAESVTPAKRAKILVATRLLLAQRADLAALPVRFDVVSLDALDQPDWRRGAFDATS